MVNCITGNVRGLNAPNKQREVKHLYNEVMSARILKQDKVQKIIEKQFNGGRYTTNLNSHYNGRIIVLWIPDFYRVTPLSLKAPILL